jgi:hypothetical protein
MPRQAGKIPGVRGVVLGVFFEKGVGGLKWAETQQKLVEFLYTRKMAPEAA